MRKSNAEYSRRWRGNNREKDREIHIYYYNEIKDTSCHKINNKDKYKKNANA